MVLIATLIALFAERLLPALSERRRLDFVDAYRLRLLRILPGPLRRGALAVTAVLAFPVLLAGGIDALLDDGLWRLFGLAFAVVVLFPCLRPGGLDESVDAYIAAREAGEDGVARRHAQTLIGGEMPQDVEGEVRAVADAVIWQSNERLFGVLFWFLLFGPAGAVLFRLSAGLAEGGDGVGEEPRAAARRLFALLGWMPARLMAAAFVLVGSFEDGLNAWRVPPSVTAGADDPEAGSRSLVERVGQGALRAEAAVIVRSGHGGSQETDATLVRAARALVFRSLLTWVALVALLTLAGVIH